MNRFRDTLEDWVRVLGDGLGFLADQVFALLGAERERDAETLRRARSERDVESRYAKLRLWIAGAFGADVVATLIFVVTSATVPPSYEVWFERSFPANMVIVRSHSGSPIREAELVIDGRWKMKVDRLVPGPNGFPFNVEFRDPTDSPPPVSYEPKELEIRAGGDVTKLPIGPRGKP